MSPNQASVTLQTAPAIAGLGREERLQFFLLLGLVAVCGGLMLYLWLPPWIALAGALGLAGVILVFAYPFSALYVLLCLFFFPMNLGEFTIVQAGGALTVFVALVSTLYRDRSLRAGPFLLPILCFGMVMLLSLVYARFLNPVFGDLYRLFSNVLIYLLVLILVNTPDRLRHILGAFLVAGASNAVHGLYTSYVTGNTLDRAAGFVGNANRLGFICSFALPIAFHRFAEAEHRLHRYAYLALCGVLFAGLTVSASRGATLALLAGMLLCVYQIRRRPRLLIPVMLIAAVLLSLAPKVFFERVSNLSEDVEHSVEINKPQQLTSRGYLFKTSVRVWKDHPIWGVGVGNFGKYFITANYNPGWERSKEMPQHNLYLHVLVENGVVGFLVFSWILWRLGRLLLFMHRSAECPVSRRTREILNGVGGAAVVFAVMALSMDFLYTHELYILLSLVYLTSEQARKEIAFSSPLQRVYSS